MAGRKKDTPSAAQSTKQKTLLDHFSKKTTSHPAQQPAILQQTPVDNVTDAPASGVLKPPSTTSPAPPSEAADIIDITGPEPTLPPAPPPKNAELQQASNAVEIIDITGATAIGSPLAPPYQMIEPQPKSNAVDIIDITSATPTVQPALSVPVEPQPFSSNEGNPTVIDLTSDPPTPAPKPQSRFHSIFATRPKIEARTSQQAPKQVYSIFNVQPKKLINSASPAESSLSKKDSEASLPTKENQHVRGLQTVFSAPPFPLRHPRQDVREQTDFFRIPQDASVRGLEPLRTLARTPVSSFWEKEHCIESIPSEHKRGHPAIARLSAAITAPPDASSSSEKLWCDRWRPQRADSVLGNEANALFLRDWLRALEIHFDNPGSSEVKDSRGGKRRQVMRSVSRPKKRRRQSSDEFEWIVSDASDYSSEAEGPVESEGADEDEFHPAPDPEKAVPEIAASNLFGEYLANTILLHGPSGTGKTTAVYACAEELGWEVFEVYPGIGRRNGASLETLIGEVGKNHLVRGTQGRGTPARGRDTNSDPDFGFVTPKLQAGTRQSVILLEEVDILFREDANFWPAVIRLIRDCKRAVICTCNDVSLVPVGELPLQTILEFQPCPSDVAGSYLHGLCCAEGHIVNRDTLTELYASGWDLRHTIHRLQLLCQGFSLGGYPEPGHFLDWTTAPQNSVPHADRVSFLDAYATRSSLDRPKALAATQYDPGADDELGYPILAEALTDGYGLHDWDAKIIRAVTAVSRESRLARAECEQDSRADYRELIDALRNNPAIPLGVMEREEAHTDYVPRMREMIAAEDVLEAGWRGVRGTRNSGRYLRSVEVDEQTQSLLTGSMLPSN